LSKLLLISDKFVEGRFIECEIFDGLGVDMEFPVSRANQIERVNRRSLPF
jgi:hypothetical protein